MKKRLVRYSSIIASFLLAMSLVGCMDPAVSDATRAIDSIGEVTLESKEAIEDAEEKYNMLDDEQKQQVENYAELEKAISRFEEVENESECVEAIASGLMLRLDAENQDVESFSARATGVSAAIQGEMDAITALSDLKYGEEFGRMLDSYLSSLSNQVEGLGGYPSDTASYNDLYVEKGLKAQIECIKNLSEKYGLTLEGDYSEKLSELIEDDPLILASPEQELEVSTDLGDVKVAFDGFVVSGQNTNRAIESGGMTSEQEYGSLLITIENVSYNDPDIIAGGSDVCVNTEDVFHLRGMDGAVIGAFNSSWGYPGYEFGSTYLGIDYGLKKKIEITYAIDAGTPELEVAVSPNISVILPVERV